MYPLSFYQIKSALYSLYLTNKFGLKLLTARTSEEKTHLRLEYSETLLSKLNIHVETLGAEKITQGGQYLIVCNHRSIIDPLIIELAFKGKGILGHWVSKKELYNSFFFGLFTRNAGTILLDRESSQMSAFFKEVKEQVKKGDSISIFPEGTRNMSDEPLSAFKEGSQIIAVKNRLNILPVFIETNANAVLKDSLKNNSKDLKIIVRIGDEIHYKDRSMTLEEVYRQQFNLTAAD